LKIKKTGLILFILFSFLGIFSPSRGELKGKLFIFNTLQDYLKGDIWEFITQEEIGKHLFIYPEKYLVFGIGTTDRTYRTGEVIVKGKVDDIHFLWANPEYPNRIEHLEGGRFPWLNVGVCDPSNSNIFNLRDISDLHKYVLEKMVKDGIKAASIRIFGTFEMVRYTVSYHLPKNGLNLSKGHRKDEYYRSYQVTSRSNWEIIGIYISEDIANDLGSISGQPLLLEGYEVLSNRGGLVDMAKVHRAKLIVYPLKEWEVFQSDLVVKGVKVEKDTVLVDVANQGGMNTKHVKIRLILPDSKRSFTLVVSEIGSRRRMEIDFGPILSANDKTIQVQVDPDNDIHELNENNNQFEVKYR
jgi:hypothetical protein